MTMMISGCNFPTQVLVLDDDKDFADGLKYGIRKYYKCVCVNHVEPARQLIQQNQNWVESVWGETVSRIYQDEDPTLFSVSMDVSLLSRQIYNPDRFNHFTVLVIDYDMPEQNGLDFIRSLEEDSFKVVMLTGKASQGTVIEAFNNKEIHRYVSKGDPNYVKTILQCIRELQNEFFMDETRFIMDSLRTSEAKVFSNKAYQALFNQIVQENNIVEYYLLDELGSFFFQDAEANNQVWFIVKSDEELRYLYEIASNDKDSDPAILQRLSDCQILPYFKESDENHLPVREWHFLEAKPLDDSGKYYYAVVKNDEGLEVDKEEIKTYAEFLQE